VRAVKSGKPGGGQAGRVPGAERAELGVGLVEERPAPAAEDEPETATDAGGAACHLGRGEHPLESIRWTRHAGHELSTCGKSAACGVSDLTDNPH
jgi:hypothetical protein